MITANTEITSRWYALYTKSRHEKFIDGQLKKRSLTSFLPLQKLRRRWSDRFSTVEEPLFKGYVFVKTNPFQRKHVLAIKGAVKFVSAGRRPIAITEKEISSIKILVENQAELEPYPYLREGDRVVVRRGPFKDTEGYIIRKNSKDCQLVVSIDSIMRSVSLKIDASLVEKI